MNHIRTKWGAATAIMATLLSSAAPLPLAAQGRTSPREGLCRTPAALPGLGREQNREQQVRPSRAARTDDDIAYAPPPVMVAPDDASLAELPAYEAPAPGAAERDRSDVVVTATRAGDAGSERRIAPPVPRPDPRPRPQPQPQAGTLTAGEHDDLLNPELYARYVNRSNLGQSIRDLPRVDTERTLTVRVTDSAGQPVPLTDVRLRCADGNSITLATQADGSVVFFPELDRLGRDVTITVGRNAQPRRVAIAGGPGQQSIGFTVADPGQRVTKLDLMLVVDTTGSMGDEIDYLKTELQSIVAAIRRQHRGLDLRVGFVFYRDLGDDYVTRTIAFTPDVAGAQQTIAREDATGGGDYPEAMDQAMIRAVGQAWRPDAIKSMLLVADAPPHDDLVARTWAAAEVARQRRIHIVPVAASGVADEAEYVMRAMAALTQSRYLFLTDDSGVGNPHAAPAIDCYLVTRLDSAIRRVIDSQLSGRRVEPAESEVIRSVGQYDAGRCILPRDFSKT